MRIGILGTRGIPNNYGGFEQFAQYLAQGLVQRGHQVTVYCSHSHPYKLNDWHGVKLIHCWDPENSIGTAGQFVYDFSAIMDSRKRNFDVLLQLGYTSSSVWGWLLPKGSIVTTNMDGLEWKRNKYSSSTRKFLKYAEKLAIKHSNFWVADSIGIQDYLRMKYNVSSVYIPYGAHIFDSPDIARLKKFDLQAYKYNMLIARLEPENNIETILDGIVKSGLNLPFLVVGNYTTKYGKYIKDKYHHVSFIKFTGGIYDLELLNNLRYFSNIYLHGHTVGGTNPSLLEAMSSSALIFAHDNVFNRSILGEDAFYFKNSDDISNVIPGTAKSEQNQKLDANLKKIGELYQWDRIIDEYEQHFHEILNSKASLS